MKLTSRCSDRALSFAVPLFSLSVQFKEKGEIARG